MPVRNRGVRPSSLQPASASQRVHRGATGTITRRLPHNVNFRNSCVFSIWRLDRVIDAQDGRLVDVRDVSRQTATTAAHQHRRERKRKETGSFLPICAKFGYNAGTEHVLMISRHTNPKTWQRKSLKNIFSGTFSIPRMALPRARALILIYTSRATPTTNGTTQSVISARSPTPMWVGVWGECTYIHTITKYISPMSF